jgi:hypothetical protein
MRTLFMIVNAESDESVKKTLTGVFRGVSMASRRGGGTTVVEVVSDLLDKRDTLCRVGSEKTDDGEAEGLLLFTVCQGCEWSVSNCFPARHGRQNKFPFSKKCLGRIFYVQCQNY